MHRQICSAVNYTHLGYTYLWNKICSNMPTEFMLTKHQIYSFMITLNLFHHCFTFGKGIYWKKLSFYLHFEMFTYLTNLHIFRPPVRWGWSVKVVSWVGLKTGAVVCLLLLLNRLLRKLTVADTRHHRIVNTFLESCY